MKKYVRGLLVLSLILLLAACDTGPLSHPSSSSHVMSDSLIHISLQPTATPTSYPLLSIPSHIATQTPMRHKFAPPPATPTYSPPPPPNCVTFSNDTTQVPPKNGGLSAPYGPAPISGEAQQLTQQLFQLINYDRSACGLPPFTWSATLASGALLHSWNMYHCGFSHTCPDGSTPYQRIANEGFGGYRDCGENIGLAGPYPTPWAGVYAVQESMAHEPLGGWHRIHLFSTTLYQIGIGIYAAPNGWLWFTEDMVS